MAKKSFHVHAKCIIFLLCIFNAEFVSSQVIHIDLQLGAKIHGRTMSGDIENYTVNYSHADFSPGVGLTLLYKNTNKTKSRIALETGLSINPRNIRYDVRNLDLTGTIVLNGNFHDISGYSITLPFKCIIGPYNKYISPSTLFTGFYFGGSLRYNYFKHDSAQDINASIHESLNKIVPSIIIGGKKQVGKIKWFLEVEIGITPAQNPISYNSIVFEPAMRESTISVGASYRIINIVKIGGNRINPFAI